MPAILLDIEGTTTDISFVHQTLFPYSRDGMDRFIRTNYQQPIMQEYLRQIAEDIHLQSFSHHQLDLIISQLIQWIDNDVKNSSLKGIQGLQWEQGYSEGTYQSHIYEDVLPALKKWKEENYSIGIFSSGSIKAQKLLFRYSKYGDLRMFFNHFFDTKTGPKKEPDSYLTIAKAMGYPPNQIHFFSDVTEELDAAKKTGYQTTQMVRDGTVAGTAHPTVGTFLTT